jgi:hydrogenase maturation factor
LRCDEQHCVTCSDEAIEMRVLDPGRDGVAVCDRGEVMTDLVGPVDSGDVVLVHAGVAIARVDGRRLDGAPAR